jgi:hypothetical protein
MFTDWCSKFQHKHLLFTAALLADDHSNSADENPLFYLFDEVRRYVWTEVQSAAPDKALPIKAALNDIARELDPYRKEGVAES